jgi:hypothetical protein
MFLHWVCLVSAVPEFDQFVIDSIVPSCFAAIAKPTFNLADAQVAPIAVQDNLTSHQLYDTEIALHLNTGHVDCGRDRYVAQNHSRKVATGIRTLFEGWCPPPSLSCIVKSP